jgi:N-acetylated-alpha-linked acidic dipeptidase
VATPEAVRVGDLGSGSDFTPFFQHVGVPSTDIGSDGPYGVYHSVFDNYNWFIKNSDPTFVYEQQMARVFGIELLHMADADVLPYDYRLYGKDVEGFVSAAKRRAGAAKMEINFSAASEAAARFEAAGEAVYKVQTSNPSAAKLAALNASLRDTETALLIPGGLPHRPWFKHAIADPGEYTGYAAVVIPGVNEGLDAGDAVRTQAQVAVLAERLNAAAAVLEAAAK